MHPFVHLSIGFWLYTALQSWNSMSLNCLIFHTSGCISSSPAAFLFLISLSTKLSSSCINSPKKTLIPIRYFNETLGAKMNDRWVVQFIKSLYYFWKTHLGIISKRQQCAFPRTFRFSESKIHIISTGPTIIWGCLEKEAERWSGLKEFQSSYDVNIKQAK